MIKILTYLKKRLNERSTWVAIGGGVAAASALTPPFSWIALAVGVIAAIVPDGGVAKSAESDNA